MNFPGKQGRLLRWVLAGALPLLGAFGCATNPNPVDTSDPAITARIKTDLKAQPGLSIRFLDIDTHMGIVTLSGVVESSQQRRTIERIARRTRGVEQVVVNILIQE